MRFRVRALCVSLVALLLCGLASVATAAEPTPPLAGPGETDVQIWPGAEPGQNFVIVGVTVPEGTKRPARVRVPIPPLGQIVWAGEILGGDLSEDPRRDYEVINGAGATVAEIVIEKGREAQIEVAGKAIEKKGELSSVTVEWVQSVPSKLTGISVRMPVGATDVSIDPPAQGSPERNPNGEILYRLKSRRFKTGEAQTVKVSWKTVPVAKTGGNGGAGATNPIPIIVGLLAAAVVALIAVLFWNRGRGVGEAQEDEPKPDAAAAPKSSKTLAEDSESDDGAFRVEE
ncbi:MAG: hypothetical protein HY876_10430 [Coriobacteriales bacterium]|nr:hypothetical protein [Coriobacteriales bacterium]